MTRTRIHRRAEAAPSLASLALVPAALALAGLLYLAIDFRCLSLLLARLGCGCT